MMIGKLEEVPLREVWKHEERGFSAWLVNNLDALSNALGMNLVEAQREVKAGSFEVDLVAEDDQSNRVIIENQLEATDHDHLGKVLTYLTNLDAKTAIWITRHPRPEHIRAIQWLNETTPDDIAFYLVKLTAIRIGDSPPAPLFTSIVAPSQTSKDFCKQKKELAETDVLRWEFWKQFIELARQKGISSLAARTPPKKTWLAVSAGNGFFFNYVFKNITEVSLWFHLGTKEENEAFFEKLLSHKKEIETSFGGNLIWNKNEHIKSGEIKYPITDIGLKDQERWKEAQELLISKMEQFYNALKPFLTIS